ncbi:MAG: hypothetical protein QM785_09290 [Pyrinomonadaceae bacterium]
MYLTIKAISAILLLSVAAFSQPGSRDQVVQDVQNLKSQIDEIKSKIAKLDDEILRPDTADIAVAQGKGLNVIRLLPREKYDGLLSISGGGSFYSFVTNTHRYGYGNDLHLSQNSLSVGFAGADYGFLLDLGPKDIADLNKDSAELNFLSKYVPPKDEPAVRAEQTKSHKYEVNGVIYKRDLPAVVGNTYALRSISISDSDILVVFNVLRKDTDGSILLLWKTIETFDKPLMRRPGESVLR